MLKKGQKSKLAWSLVICMLFETFIVPTKAFALTNGPKQPEFENFTPVATSNMVNTFTGDFSYNIPVLNIPGADGGGYALSLAYNANPSPSGQASWVGQNWTLNPGALNRSKRGLPDDWKDKEIKQYNKTRPNWTMGRTQNAGINGSIEIASQSLEEGNPNESSETNLNLNAGFNRSFSFNNYTGFRRSIGFSAGASVSQTTTTATGIEGGELTGIEKFRDWGGLNFGANITGRDVVFNVALSPPRILAQRREGKVDVSGEYIDQIDKVENRLEMVESNQRKVRSSLNRSFGWGLGNISTGIISMIESSQSPTLTPYTGIAYNFESNFMAGSAYFGVLAGFSGFYNSQRNNPLDTFRGYGYLYNPTASTHQWHIDNDEYVMSDYYVEKSAPYSRRDNIVGIPFTNADLFAATGEGVNGSFRVRHDRVGHFYNNRVKNNTNIFNWGLEFNAGIAPLSVGIGADIGVGYQRMVSGKWLGKLGSNGMGSDFNNSSDLYYFEDPTTGPKPDMRFLYDKGGSVQYASTTNISSATLQEQSTIPGVKSFLPRVNTSEVNTQRVTDFSGQSAQIEYQYNSEITGNVATAQGVAFEKNKRILELTDGSRNPGGDYGDVDEGIAQIKVWNPGGTQYTYGLPVYVRNEQSLAYGVDDNAEIINRDLVYQDVDQVPENNKYVVGEEMQDAYASTYLLTQITTADYVDATNDGPSEDDFGGYTQFDYRKWKSQTQDSFYYYRSPYNGLSYIQGKLADNRDDQGLVNNGEKEVYYLNAVETKSHIAIFITNKTVAADDFDHLCPSGNCPWTNSKYNGSGDIRLDGLGADPSLNGNNLNAAGDKSAKDLDQSLEKLERIVLFSKEDNKELVSTYFEYDYSAWPNLPNHKDGNYPNTMTNAESGKLTLKKVWMEHEGVKDYRISPYEFSYEYKEKSTLKSEVRNRYPSLFADWPNYSSAAEHPEYSPYTLDQWGFHQYQGAERKKNLRDWVYQGSYSNTQPFDPAAWQLKQIKLPSGGEILIEYEQKTYSKVQDRDAMTQVSLKANSRDDTDQPGSLGENKFYLNTDDLDINSTDLVTLDALVEKIRDEYQDKPDKRIYFKFLYALRGTNPSLNSDQSEYIDGYAIVDSVGRDGGGVYVELGLQSEKDQQVDYSAKKAIPRKVCYDYVIYQYNFGSVLPMVDSFEQSNFPVPSRAEIRELFPKLRKEAGETKIPQYASICRALNFELSYLRVPMVTPKKGGGIRVKRLLMYDEGLETGDAQLYGTEYHYVDNEGNCSGVASNEPAAARQENALVSYEPRNTQSFLNRIFAGRDRKELEAPLGESILPAPSIGYSQVVVQNIFKGKANSGHTVHQFYTHADYPYDYMYQLNGNQYRGVDFTKIAGKKNKDFKRRDLLNLPLGYINYSKNNTWLAQGFRFLQNQMHGQPRSIATYPGVFTSGSHNKNKVPSTETVYEYYEPGESVNVIEYDQGTYKVKKRDLGMEMDVTMLMQAIKDEIFDFNVEFDIHVTFAPSVLFTLAPSFSYTFQGTAQHLTSKVVSYPVITKAVTSSKNGLSTRTEYLAFSDLTGEPLVTRHVDLYDGIYVQGNSSEAHDGSIYTWNLPAAWYYPELGQRHSNDNAYNQLSAMAGSVSSYGKEGNPLSNLGGNGDEITWTSNPQNVLSASAMTFKKEWLSSELEIQNRYNVDPSDLAALDSVWRPKTAYVFEGRLSQADELTNANANTRTYKGGIIQNFSFFDWTNPPQDTLTQDSLWRWTSKVEKYTPNGYPVQETNSVNIPSAAKYGYDKFLPVLTAQNAEYVTVGFESFEDDTYTGGSTSTTQSHTGDSSLVLSGSSTSPELIDNLRVTEKLVDSNRGGYQVKLWAYNDPGNPIDFATDFEIELTGALSKNPTVVAQVGDWVLLDVQFSSTELPTVSTAIYVKVVNNSSTTSYIDDIRIQPRYAEMTTYVYNFRDFKVLATFGSEHFGMIYQYNQEGQLVRKLIETERGLKTIVETQYNSQTTPRQ